MNSPEVWRKDFLEPAIAALAKMKVAKFVGEVADASRFESEYNGYMDKLAHMDENAAKALESEVANAANDLFEANRAKLMAIKHADEPISLSHGTKWKDHKYLRIENGRYIYPDDEKIKNSKEDKYVVLRKEAYKKSNDANIAAVAGGHSSENDIAASITRSQASGMRRTADLLEAQMNEQKRQEQESKKEADRNEEIAKENREKLKNLNAELAIKRANRQRDTSENRRSEEIQKTKEKEQLEKDANDAADNFINAVIKEANSRDIENIREIGWWASNDRGSATQSITKKYVLNEDFRKSFEQNVQKKLSQIVSQINPEARGKVEAFIKQYFKR